MKTIPSWLSALAGMTLFASVACAGDYMIVRDVGAMPGTTTNIAKILPHPDGGELIEFHAWTGGNDTATLQRVSSDLEVTNQLAVLALPGPTSVWLVSSNFTAVAKAAGANDFIQVNGTGTNKFKWASVWRIHVGL